MRATATVVLAALAPTCVSWTTFHVTLEGNEHHYHVDPSFCDAVRPRFREDTAFTWTAFGCDHVAAIVRDAFDAWEQYLACSGR